MKIRPRRNRSGSRSFQLDLGILDGKRVQLSFATRAEAEAEMEKRKVEKRVLGESAASMTEVERWEIMAVRAKLAKVGATIGQAADFFLMHAGPAREIVPLRTLWQRFYVSRELNGARNRYLQQLSVSVGGFVRLYETKNAHEVSKADVQAWLVGNGWSAKTQRGYLGDVRTMFEWGKSEGAISINPAESVRVTKREDAPEIGTLNVWQCRRLLRTCLLPEHRDLLGFVAVGMFAGVRRAEIERSPVSAIDVRHGTVVVGSGSAKTRTRRVVDLPPVALEWLKIWMEGTPKQIVPKNFVKRWDRARRAAGLVPGWPVNALRHTFASMHYAQHQNETLLRAQLGHESEEILFQSYRALKTPREARLFYATRPPVRFRVK